MYMYTIFILPAVFYEYLIKVVIAPHLTIAAQKHLLYYTLQWMPIGTDNLAIDCQCTKIFLTKFLPVKFYDQSKYINALVKD